MLPLVTNFSACKANLFSPIANTLSFSRSLVEVGGIVQRVGGDPPLNGTLPTQEGVT